MHYLSLMPQQEPSVRRKQVLQTSALLLLLPTPMHAHLALALLPALGEKPIRLRGLLP